MTGTSRFEIAFVAADNSVWVDLNGTGHPIGAGLNAAPGSSPAIAQDRDGSGGWEIAFQRSTDRHLITVDSLGNRLDSGQIMADNTTPAIAALKPVALTPPPLIEQQTTITINGEEVSHLLVAKNTAPASGAGLPSISVPMGITREGLPVGLEIDSAHGGDRKRLDLARRVEAVLDKLPAPE